ncbi:MAG: Rpn family recombination-promoting nuclease/putative transposase [Treponema sp.]|nr:Rpn family recombination-promoting nuclease/putative transposase [Treponema sp.]
MPNVELEKLPDGDDGTELYDWAKFINAESEEELNMVAEKNPQVKKAVVTLRKLSDDERARDMYERREKALRDLDARERWVLQQEREKWQVVVNEKDAKLADKDAEIAALRAQLEIRSLNPQT